jgi:hypothetical protein
VTAAASTDSVVSGAQINRTEMLDFHGVSRSVLEDRIAQLVAAVDHYEAAIGALEQRLRGRVETNLTNDVAHRARGDDSKGSLDRHDAYRTALADLRELVPFVP